MDAQKLVEALREDPKAMRDLIRAIANADERETAFLGRRIQQAQRDVKRARED